MFTVFLAVLALTGAGQPSELAPKNDSAAVAKRLQVARSIAVDLQADAALMNAAAHQHPKDRVWLPNRDKIFRDIDYMHETAKELLELEMIASSRQRTLIDRVRPLMRDVAQNTKALMEHVEAGPDHGLATSYIDYVDAHEEISRQLVSQIRGAIDQGEKAPRRSAGQ
jgi:hypothetical protein